MQSLHIVEAQQFHRPFLQKLFRETSIIRDAMLHRSVDIEDRAVARRLFLVLQRRLVLLLFTEPSTRTKQSFLSAAHHLGASVAQESDAQVSSSFAKGETMHDAMRVLDGYHYAAIVMRHHDSLEMMQAAEALERTPLINAGSGAGQHPTQALLDVYTIEQELGRVDNISIAFVGDLANGRTVRSVCYLLTKFNKPRVYFVAPDVVRMRDDIKAYLTLHGVQWEETSDLLGVASQVDVIYQTRIQRERFGDRIRDYERARGKYIINKAVLDCMMDHARIMHPLPRVDEIIKEEVDHDPRAAYFRQAHNGLYVRMALLKMVAAPDIDLLLPEREWA